MTRVLHDYKTAYETNGSIDLEKLTRVERDKNLSRYLISIMGQGRFRLLANECAARGG